MPVPSFQDAKAGYSAMWAKMVISPAHVPIIDAAARQVLAAMKDKSYGEISSASGVPPVVIGLLHHMESNCDFRCHLHNGDPLTARTVHVPPGRPHIGNPVFTFTESALDALNYEGFDRITDWSIERALYEMEAYNGWGYVGHAVNSPYIWSFSNLYGAGKFTTDGHFDSGAVSEQIGVAPLLKRIMEIDPSVTLSRPLKSIPATIGASPSLRMQLAGLAAIIVGPVTHWLNAAANSFTDAINLLPSVSGDLDQFMTPAEKAAHAFNIPWDSISLGVAATCVVFSVIRLTGQKRATP